MARDMTAVDRPSLQAISRGRTGRSPLDRPNSRIIQRWPTRWRPPPRRRRRRRQLPCCRLSYRTFYRTPSFTSARTFLAHHGGNNPWCLPAAQAQTGAQWCIADSAARCTSESRARRRRHRQRSPMPPSSTLALPSLAHHVSSSCMCLQAAWQPLRQQWCTADSAGRCTLARRIRLLRSRRPYPSSIRARWEAAGR